MKHMKKHEDVKLMEKVLGGHECAINTSKEAVKTESENRLDFRKLW